MSRPQALHTFADWVATIRGEDASEAQTYVNRLLQVYPFPTGQGSAGGLTTRP